jgi:hypothetical protein
VHCRNAWFGLLQRLDRIVPHEIPCVGAAGDVFGNEFNVARAFQILERLGRLFLVERVLIDGLVQHPQILAQVVLTPGGYALAVDRNRDP